MAMLVISGKRVIVEPTMVDMRFDSRFLLSENVPDALDWPSVLREGRRPDTLLLGGFRQTSLPLAGDTLGYSAARVSTFVQQQHHLQQQQQAAEEAGSSSKLFLQNLAGEHGPRWHGLISTFDANRLDIL